MGNQKSPKIILPRDDKERVLKLKNKLKYYAERLEVNRQNAIINNPSMHPELANEFFKKSGNFIDRFYKMSVLSTLLYQGEVSTYDLAYEINEELGGLNIDYFNRACGVIDDYVKTGGKNCKNGAGLENQ